MIEKCSCTFPEFYLHDAGQNEVDLCFNDLCDYEAVIQQADCVKKALDVLAGIDCTKCQQPRCHSWSYPTSVSSLDYLNSQTSLDRFMTHYSSMDSVHESLNDIVTEYGNLSNIPSDFMKNNFILVDVFFTDYYEFKKEAKRVMMPYDLFSSFGGALGFWAGFSILTLVEVLEWLLRTLTLSCFKEKVEPRKDKCSIAPRPSIHDTWQ